MMGIFISIVSVLIGVAGYVAVSAFAEASDEMLAGHRASAQSQLEQYDRINNK